MEFATIDYSGYKKTLVYNKIICDGVEYASGDFIKDWYDLMIDIHKNQRYEYVVFFSSLNHFFFDGGDYDAAYLVEDESGVWDFIYTNDVELDILKENMFYVSPHEIILKEIL